jgi:hypothetical protein
MVADAPESRITCGNEEVLAKIEVRSTWIFAVTSESFQKFLPENW